MSNRPLVVALAGLLVATLVTAGTVVAQQPTEGTDPEAGAGTIASAATYDSATSTGLAPDENPPASAGAGPSATNQTFRYFMVSGATLRGRTSSTALTYTSVGCSYVSAGPASLIANTEMHIPDGSIIKFLRVIYNDTSNTGSVRGYLTRYTPGQVTNDLVSVASTAAFNGGFGFTVSAEITETVNNTPYAYTLIGWPSAASSALQVCGLRIAYYPPTSGTAYIPSVQRSP
jgi:hypothetical protein